MCVCVCVCVCVYGEAHHNIIVSIHTGQVHKVYNQIHTQVSDQYSVSADTLSLSIGIVKRKGYISNYEFADYLDAAR